MCIEVQVEKRPADSASKEQRVTFSYTRNDAGGLQDAIDLLMNHLALQGVKVEVIQGRLCRPKSDSFEEFAPYFDRALLQRSSGSPEGLNRSEKKRLSGDVSSILGDKMAAEPGRVMSDTEAAFYNGDRRRSSGHESFGGVPGSVGSSSRGSYHSRSGSRDLD